MKCNYPVKYVSMPITEQIGWSHGLNELERRDHIVCYIVSKCYLLSDKTKYKENGKRVKEYEVVFPYQRGQYGNWERVIPEFSLMDFACTNSDFVDKTFDSYEEALEDATKKNKELCDKTWINLPYTKDLNEQILKRREEFNDKLSRYKMLEQQILIHTSDLKQSSIKELNKLIKSYKGKINVLSTNLYEYLKFFSASNFIVYYISKEQYDKLRSLIDNQDICDISKTVGKSSPILYNRVNNQNIMVINQNGNVLYYIDEWENLKDNEDETIPSVELHDIDGEMTYLFTTETLDDILLSFKKHENIDFNKIQGPILRKTLFDRNKS